MTTTSLDTALPTDRSPALGDDGLPLDLRCFFISGTRSSGHQWLIRMLDAHPQIACAGEAFLVSGGVSGRSVSDWIDAEAVERWLGFPAAGRWAEARSIDANEVARVCAGPIARAVMRRGVMCDAAKRPNLRAVGDCSPFAYCTDAERLAELFPESVFVHLVRDGRDVAVSNVFSMLRNPARYSDYDMEHHAEIDRIRAWFLEELGSPERLVPAYVARREAAMWAKYCEGAAVAREIFGDRFIQVRYEDLLHDRAALEPLLAALGVDQREEIVSACDASGTTRPGNTPAALGCGITGDWQNHFDDESNSIFEEVCGELLRAYGYSD